MSRIVDPVLADLQSEYEQLGGATHVRGAWVAGIWYVRLAAALALHLALETLRPYRRERGTATQTIAWSSATFAAITMLFILPPLFASRWDAPITAQLTLYLIPQAVPLSLPAGMSVGVLLAMRSKRATASRITMVCAVAGCAAFVALATIEWLVPYANQQFRELVAARVTGRSVRLEPGLNELGFSGLLRRGDPAALYKVSVLLALSFAAIPIALFALTIARRVRRAISGIGVGVVLAVGYMQVLSVLDAAPSELTLQILLTPWVPNALCLLGAAGLLCRGRERQTRDA